MKIPKWMVPPIDWRPKPAEPYWLERCRRFFWLLTALGLLCFFGSFLGLADTLWEGLAMAVLGAALTAGAGGTLALSYEKVPKGNVFLVKILCRVGFMAVAPALLLAVLAGEPMPWEEIRRLSPWWAALCGVTVLPFGLSLLKLILKHRREKAPWER